LIKSCKTTGSWGTNRVARRPTGWIAGINHGNHDASAVLLHEGKLIVWVEQERLSRTKHAIGESPAKALRACLDFAGIDLSDLDLIALGSDHDRLSRWLGLDPEQCDKLLPFDQPSRLFPAELFGTHCLPPLVTVPHHQAHAASAWYPSALPRAAGLVMDAMGEDTSTTIVSCNAESIKICAEYGVEDSLGFFYEAAALYAGFTRFQTGKLMGLASYGIARQDMPIAPPVGNQSQIWRLHEARKTKGREGINTRETGLLAFFEAHCFPHSRRSTAEVMVYQDFAASAQKALEGVILVLARRARDLSNTRALTLSGGVALNCSANGVLSRSGLVDQLFIQPASTDSGVAYGAALVAASRTSTPPIHSSPMSHAYWGLPTQKAEIRSALLAARLDYRELDPDEMCEAVAKCIARHRVVAWHQGRAEIGPRALGARSILGNPQHRATLAQINKIKGRELWRPLAPSILAEAFDTWFEGMPNPFMLISSIVRPTARARIPAVTHVDGTARPQAVTHDAAPLFHQLLRRIEAHTGVPIVINTSLNGPEEPISHRAKDTIDLFQTTALDALAIGDFFVEKPAEPKPGKHCG
jgi:carbamoyltransferase